MPFGGRDGFSDMLPFPSTAIATAAAPAMKLDIKENDTSFVVHAEAPGFNKDEVTLELDDNNILHISANKQAERDESGVDAGGWKYHRRERSTANQYRSVKLPQNINTSDIRADYGNGIVDIFIPKRTVGATSDRRRIDFSS
jgi:HSP20 family protein